MDKKLRREIFLGGRDAEVFRRNVQELIEQGVRLTWCERAALANTNIDQLARFAAALDPRIQKKVLKAIELTRNNDRLILNVAFNYSGRDEIVYAIQQIIAAGISSKDVTDEMVNRHLFTAGIPDPDLIIRTSGELRLSNFLIWQAAYSEWYISPKYWPDFDKEEYRRALESFASRDRRYGKVASKEYEASNV